MASFVTFHQLLSKFNSGHATSRLIVSISELEIFLRWYAPFFLEVCSCVWGSNYNWDKNLALVDARRFFHLVHFLRQRASGHRYCLFRNNWFRVTVPSVLTDFLVFNTNIVYCHVCFRRNIKRNANSVLALPAFFRDELIFISNYQLNDPEAAQYSDKRRTFLDVEKVN